MAAETTGRLGDVTLLGLARDVAWQRSAPGYDYVLACGLAQGQELAVHVQPAASSKVAKRLPPLTTLEVDTSARRAGWVRVVGADASFSPTGERRAYTSLIVEGWAEDANLCAFSEDN